MQNVAQLQVPILTGDSGGIKKNNRSHFLFLVAMSRFYWQRIYGQHQSFKKSLWAYKYQFVRVKAFHLKVFFTVSDK